jgi:bifunctional DNA-binding transcriptional regulator/antitoxin component of YhaV-PrlF toxin-antitoxin module
LPWVKIITGRLTSKTPTTIPRVVRGALGLEPGDEIAHAIEHEQAFGEL